MICTLDPASSRASIALSGKYLSLMYLCDNEMQLMTAMEDYDYTCWLDPDRVPCYIKDDNE